MHNAWMNFWVYAYALASHFRPCGQFAKLLLFCLMGKVVPSQVLVSTKSC